MRILALAALTLLLALTVAAAPKIPETAEAVKPLEVGDRAPLVTLRDVDGEPAPLDAWVGRGLVALVFYRGGW